jgi:hypothetical protein
MRQRKPKPPPTRDMILDPIAREWLRHVLKLARDATSFLPERCQSFLYGRPRNLRYELKDALDRLEDHLERQGEGFYP